MDFATWLDTAFHGFDYGILSFFHGLQCDFLNGFFIKYTELGSLEFEYAIIILSMVLCVFKKTRKVGVSLFFAVLIGLLITNILLKPMVMRARPYVTMINDKFYDWYLAAGAINESRRSFPSGHSTFAFAMGTVLFLNFKKKISWIFIVLAFIIAMSRLYLMVHYPTDVIVGILIGIFAGSIGYFISKMIIKQLSKTKIKNLHNT